jgi:glycosyltransferase involved in cell wall biosynthesis
VVEHILARCQSCADRVHYHPAIPRTRLLPVIEHALAAVLPSRVDNYPNACLDAVGVGTPVIGTYHSSVDEIVSDGRTGFLALNGNSDSIIAAIERLCALPPQDYQDLRRRVRDLAAAMESEDRVGQLIDFYRSVVAGFRGTGDAAATDNDTRLKTG